jgi:hypothetical protein
MVFLLVVGLVDEMKQLGLQADVGITKLREGYGETVCIILDMLSSHVLEKKNFRFLAPVHSKQSSSQAESQPDDQEEEEEILVADETIVDDEENEEVLDTFDSPRETE